MKTLVVEQKQTIVGGVPRADGDVTSGTKWLTGRMHVQRELEKGERTIIKCVIYEFRRSPKQKLLCTAFHCSAKTGLFKVE